MRARCVWPHCFMVPRCRARRTPEHARSTTAIRAIMLGIMLAMTLALEQTIVAPAADIGKSLAGCNRPGW